MKGTKLRAVLPILGLLTVLAAASWAITFHGYFVRGPELWLDGPEAVSLATGVYPDIALDSSGTAIAVWGAIGVDGGDGLDIQLRRFALDGSPLADPVLVNTVTTDAQTYPRIAVAPDDSFLVIWESYESVTRGATPYYRVKGQAYAATGSPVGPERTLSTLSTGENVQLEADVAALTGGGYVVVWHSWNSDGTDQSNRSMQARLVNADGSPNGGQFQCNTLTGGQQHEGAVTELPDGGFLVVWSDQDLVGRRFDSAGQGVGTESSISATPAFNQRDPDVAINGVSGQVAVIWVDDWDGNSIRARLLDSSTLAPLGAGFRVNDLNDMDQEYPRLGAFGDEGFFVAWSSDTSGGDDATGESVQARVITGTSLFDSPQFQVNAYTTSHQWQPAVGASAGGNRLAIAYKSSGNDSTLSEVITGQRFTYCLFCDDFESGDTSLWTNKVR